VWNQRQIDTRDVDDQSYGDANYPHPEAPVLVCAFPIGDVVVRVPWRMRSLLWVVMLDLTHALDTNSFRSGSKVVAFISRDIKGLPQLNIYRW